MGSSTNTARATALKKSPAPAAPDFGAYAQAAQTYLNRPVFQGTPLTGQMLAQAAAQVYKQTGTVVPVELALAQGQMESHMGTKGRNPRTNPYNVGEFDAGTMQRFATPQDGVNAYYNLMANNYLKGKTADDLRTNFVNTAGKRYASNPQYEQMVGGQMDFIKKHYLNPQGAGNGQ